MAEIKNNVYGPQESSRLAVERIKYLESTMDMGIKSGIIDLDKKMVPFRPGELVIVMGYTSHYKSGFMNWLVRQAIETIPQNDDLDADQDVVVKFTWEQSIEEDTLSWLASDSGISITQLARGLISQDEWVKLNESATNRATTPLILVGHSEMENKERRKARPRMTMTNVANALEYICSDMYDYKQKPRMVVMDYLQRIRPDEKDGNTRREQMMEAVNRAKDCAIAFGCPVVLGVQSGRGVLDRQNKMPQIDDGQETSNIEQSSDKVFGLWYPIKTVGMTGSRIETDSGSIEITPNLLMLSLLKQKLGPAPLNIRLYVDPERNIIGSMEMV
jgi:replicative DNA helicase